MEYKLFSILSLLRSIDIDIDIRVILYSRVYSKIKSSEFYLLFKLEIGVVRDMGLSGCMGVS